MDRPDLLASVLVDEAIAVAMMPWACPCDFGPEARYRLEELVGAGPRSLVYKAHDRLLSSEGFSAEVAVKVMRPGGASAEREALTARRINHKYVVRVLDRGEDTSGYSYLVTEFLDGGDMSQRTVPWVPADAVRFMAKVARGIQAAHSAGVVHCDLKPSNVLITADGDPKIGDFDLSASALNTSSHGRGNVAFMSPEQFAGEENSLSPPSDIYALGGLLFHLLTGQFPNGSTHLEVTNAHASAPLRARIKGDIGRICSRAMAHKKEDRYHSAGEFADDLERCLLREPIPWVRVGVHRRAWLWARRHPVWAAGLSVLLIGGGTTLGAAQYERVQKRERDLKAAAEAVRIADENVESIKARVRSTIRSLALGLTSPGNDLEDRMLPGLTWLEWLGDYHVLGDDGKVALSAERIKSLRTLLKSLQDEGRGEHEDAMLARYCLAYFLISDGSSTEALHLLSALDQFWVPRLDKDDPIAISIRGMRLCAEANTSVLAGESVASAVEPLEKLYRMLLLDGRCGPVRRLVERTMDRLKQAGSGQASLKP